jgi:hypothetical protein
MPSPSRESSLQGPPPLTQAGGLSISDAFEGLNAAPVNSMMPPPRQATWGMDSGHQRAPSPLPSSAPSDVSTGEKSNLETAGIREPPEIPKTTQQLKSTYNMGEANEELGKLKAVLQKLQAENISLRATMGSLTDEEKEVQKEINATVAEIGKLSNELTGLRAKVLAAKARLLEATAELKACHEKKGYVFSHISEIVADHIC